MKSQHCLNCGHTIKENFCPNCGQKASEHRLNWHYLLHEIPHSYLHIDKGIFLTIKELTLRPGLAIREYLDGKRVKYFKPMMYLLILGTIAGLINLYSPAAKTFAKDAQTLELVDQLQHLIGKYGNAISVITIPLLALVTWLFHRKERNYVEIVTIYLFTIGHLSLLTLLNLSAFATENKTVLVTTAVLTSVLHFVYEVWVYQTVFTRRSFRLRLTISISIAIINIILRIELAILALILYSVFVLHTKSLQINFGL